ncbi:hypothetical protein OGAPHI_003601 [Ogataea philodendri]|uniref:Uncharacterized protein n=1 Tax=Ogataea philodendri TaxID=1378263 RepID=A0A9P8P581_9ASCO|nr:uncharacterized protein OGAPHI_003601 [Ogataea philodendri]KAH3665417.1 hypothetical protein OGAPHI_003601 [Ogataea philodendri]
MKNYIPKPFYPVNLRPLGKDPAHFVDFFLCKKLRLPSDAFFLDMFKWKLDDDLDVTNSGRFNAVTNDGALSCADEGGFDDPDP